MNPLSKKTLSHCCVKNMVQKANEYDKNGKRVGKGKGDLNDWRRMKQTKQNDRE